MKKYILRQQALEEYKAAIRYYTEISPRLGRRFVADFIEYISLLRDFPDMGKIYVRDAHVFSLKYFPYDIVYALRDDVISVIAVSPQRRKPGYWLNRL